MDIKSALATGQKKTVKTQNENDSMIHCVMLCYEFLSRIDSSVLRVNCYQQESCVGDPSAFNSPFGHGSCSHNICPLDNPLPGLSISFSGLALS